MRPRDGVGRRVNAISRAAAGEEGMALITVIVITMIMLLLATAAVASLTSEFGGVALQRRVSSARDAGDAGIDQLVFTLQQGTNWTSFQTSYNSTTGGWWRDTTLSASSPCYNWGWAIGKGCFRAHIDCSPADNCNFNPNDRLATVQGQFPAGTGPVRTIQALLRRQAPAALTFAIFADRGFDEHHHGSSWMSPTIVTTQVHSNGYIKLDWSSSFHVDHLEAATSIDVGSGGGSTPGGSIPASGYNWAYWISGSDTLNSPRCYPAKVYPPKTISNADPSFSTYWNVPDGSHNCPATPKYSPNAQVIGNLEANSVTIGTHGDTVSAASGTTCTGTTQAGFNDPITTACIADRPGDIDAGTVKLGNSTTYTGASTGNAIVVHYRSGTTPAPCSGANCVSDCSSCNQGTSDQASHLGGVINLHPVAWTPGTVPFPSLNYRGVYYPKAQADQGGAASCANKTKTCHIFPTSDGKDFLTYLATKENVTGGYPDTVTNTPSCVTCVYWLDANKKDTTDPTHVQYVIAYGTYFLTGNSGLNLDWQNIRTLFGTPSTAPTPTIMIAGNLIVESGSLTIHSSLTVVGCSSTANCMSPFNPLGVYAGTTIPGLLAVGGNITANDYDSDSNWTSTSQYEALKRNATTVRGLVYSASWSNSLQASVPTDQHWHNYDPKNVTTIIGAQVGGHLHDCNSFSFDYDPLVANLLGFSGSAGGIYVVSWQEL